MSNLFDNDIGKDKPALARGVVGIVGLVLLTFSAVTTASFFFNYAGDIFNFLTPTLSPYLSAVVGVVCFEGMSVGWRWMRINDADTTRQLSLAGVGAWLALICGILVTVVFLSLETVLLDGVLDDNSRMMLNVTGALLIIVGVSGNFVLYHFYSDSSSATTAAANEAELRAAKAQAQHKILWDTQMATLAQSLNEVRKMLPERAKRQGEINADQFASEVFSSDGQRKRSFLPLGQPTRARDDNDRTKNDRPTHGAQ